MVGSADNQGHSLFIRSWISLFVRMVSFQTSLTTSHPALLALVGKDSEHPPRRSGRIYDLVTWSTTGGLFPSLECAPWCSPAEPPPEAFKPSRAAPFSPSGMGATF